MADEEKGFSVKDRRMFSGGEGEKQEKEVEPEVGANKNGIESPPQSETAAEADDNRFENMPLPEVNFPTFILSLNASALMHLGAIEDPETGRPSKNLPMAKQTIDILSMLEEKTRGNLTKEEENMLKNILYDLRIAFVREKT